MGQEHSSLAVPIDLVNMDTPRIYEIHVEGHLGDQWSNWFDGLAIRNDPNGETTLTGLLVDQSALFGVLSKIHDLNLVLISVSGHPALSTAERKV
jgi:hypothetical protein